MYGTHLYSPGDVIPLRVFLWDGSAARTGKTVVGWIRRQSDDYYWDGAAWGADYATVSFTEQIGSTAIEGTYEYEFASPATANSYSWGVKFTDSDAWLTYFKGEFQTTELLDNVETLMTRTSGGVSVTVTAPTVDDSGQFYLIQGDDYNNTDGRAISIVVLKPTGITVTSATCELTITSANDPDEFLTVSGIVSDETPSAGYVTFRFELTATQTALLAVSTPPKAYTYDWEVQCVLATNGRIWSAEVGTCSVWKQLNAD